MNLKECLEEIRKEKFREEQLLRERSTAILDKLIQGLEGKEMGGLKIVDDEDKKGFTITSKVETPSTIEDWKIRFRADDCDNESEPEKDDEPIDCGGGLFVAGEPKEDPSKVFGIFARIDEPRREDYETREAFEADHEKYDRAVEAITACDWKNKSDDAPLHKVNAIRKEVGETPPLGIDLVGESHWFDDWVKENGDRCEPEHICCDEDRFMCDEEIPCEEKCCCDSKCCCDTKCDSEKEEVIEKLIKRIAEAISELSEDPDALATLFKCAKNL